MHIIFRVCALFGSICAAFHRVQNNSYHFSSRLHVAQNGRKLEVPRGGRGLESAIQNPSDFLEAGLGRPGVPPYRTRVLKAGALSFAPFLKVHHVLLLEPQSNPDTVYLMDFSPINSAEPNTLLRLLLGKWVPAEIRLRSVPGSLCDDAALLEKWYDINKDLCEKESRELSNAVFSKIKDREMKQFIARAINTWRPNMNLYTHNCQHFARKFINDIYNVWRCTKIFRMEPCAKPEIDVSKQVVVSQCNAKKT